MQDWYFGVATVPKKNVLKVFKNIFPSKTNICYPTFFLNNSKFFLLFYLKVQRFEVRLVTAARLSGRRQVALGGRSLRRYPKPFF